MGKIHNLAVEATSAVTTVDFLPLDKQLPNGTWDTQKIHPSNLIPAAVTIEAENFIKDGWCVEFFEDYTAGANPTLSKGIGWDGNGAGSGLSIASKSIYTGKSENRLIITGGQYGRKLYFGDFWGRIQIGILFRINGGATFTGDGYVGVCSGTTNMVASASTDNFAGIRWSGVGDGASNTWAFSAGTVVNKYTQSTSTRFSTRRGTTTDQGVGSGSDGRVFSATEGYRSMLFLEIERPVFASDATSITYSFGMRSTSSVLVEFSLSKRSFVDVMLDVVATTLASLTTGVVIMGGSAVTHSFAFDQSTGKLDTVNISWPNATQTMEITAIAVRKVY